MTKEDLTDAEKFIFSFGSVAEKINPEILEKNERRFFVRLAGKIVADMISGSGTVDFGEANFPLFIKEYKRIKGLIS